MTDTYDRAAPMHADSIGARRLLITTLLIVAAAAFTAGVVALVEAGHRAGLGHLAWVVPIVVDGGLVVAALAQAIRRSNRQRAGLETTTLAALVVLSVAVQAEHAWRVAEELLPTLVGAALPLVVLASSHAAIRAVLAPPVKRGRATQSATTAAAAPPVAQPVADRPAVTRQPAARPAATMTLADALAAVRAGQLSQRQAAVAAGVSRHRIAQELAT